MTLKLGKTAARPDAIQFKLADVLKTSALPPRPATFGHQALVKAWHMLGNDRYGDCVCAGAGHETMLTNKIVGKTVSITEANALGFYTEVTGFNPKDPSTDNGTDMQAAASFRRKTGFPDSKKALHQIAAYLEPKKASVEQMLDATYYLDMVGIGFEFPDYAMDQFNKGQPWDVVANQPAPQDGHYVPCVGFDGTYFLVVTWGKVQKMTPAFFAKYTDEAIAYVFPEALNAKGLSAEGFNLAQLQSMLAQVSAPKAAA